MIWRNLHEYLYINTINCIRGVSLHFNHVNMDIDLCNMFMHSYKFT